MPINILYPAQIDNTISIPTAIDNVTGVRAVVVNTLQQAVFAIEGELGVKPSGIYSTVRARLDALEALYDNLFNTQFTNDLSGLFPSPTVVGLYNRPIANIAPQAGQALVWSGLYWMPVTVSGGGGGILSGDVTGALLSNTVIKLQGNPVSSTAPSSGQVLTWNGSNWLPQTPGSGFTAGGDLSGTSTSQTVIGIRNHSVPNPSTANTTLVWNGTAFVWAAVARVSWTTTDLYVDPANVTGAASDSNDGLSAAAPLLTFAKVNSMLFLADVSVGLSIHVLSSWQFSPDESLDFSTVSCQGGGSIVIDGSLAINYSANIIHSGSITDQTPMVTGTNTQQTITDGAYNFNGVTFNTILLVDTTNNTTTAVAPAPTTVSSTTVVWTFAGSGVLPVMSTTGFSPTGGSLSVITTNGAQEISYTSVTTNTFQGCTYLGFGRPTANSGSAVAQSAPDAVPGTIFVASTSTFPSSGTFDMMVDGRFGTTTITMNYTGKTSNSFTGCSPPSANFPPAGGYTYETGYTINSASYQNSCWMANYPGNFGIANTISTSPIMTPGGFQQGTMSVGDTYVIYTPPTISVNFNGPVCDALSFQSVTIQGNLIGGQPVFTQCYLQNIYVGGAQISAYNCYTVASGSSAFINGGVFNAGFYTSFVQISNDAVMSSGEVQFVVSSEYIPFLIINDAYGNGNSGAFFMNGLQVDKGSVVNANLNSDGYVWGNTTNNSGSSAGVIINGGSLILTADHQPPLTGTTYDFSFQSTTNNGLMTTFRAWNEGAGNYSEPIVCSWNQLYTGQTNAQDVATNGIIYLSNSQN